MSTPQADASKDCERQEVKEGRWRVQVRWGIWPSRRTTISTQVETSSRCLDDGEVGEDDERHGKHRTHGPDTTMNAGASGRDKRGLREKHEEPPGSNDGVSHRERREWKWHVSP